MRTRKGRSEICALCIDFRQAVLYIAETPQAYPSIVQTLSVSFAAVQGEFNSVVDTVSFHEHSPLASLHIFVCGIWWKQYSALQGMIVLLWRNCNKHGQISNSPFLG